MAKLEETSARGVLSKSHIHPTNLVSTEPITENENHERLCQKDQITENLKKRRVARQFFLPKIVIKLIFVDIDEEERKHKTYLNFNFWNASKI